MKSVPEEADCSIWPNFATDNCELLLSSNETYTMKQAISVALSMVILCYCFTLNAQNAQNAQNANYLVIGTVVEESSQEALDYATVIVKEKSTGDMLTGATTANGGKFSLETKSKDIAISVSFLGLKSVEIEEVNFEGKTADLGKISLFADEQSLSEVVVSGEKSTTEFKLDKRVFNVGKDISSTGVSALEVLNNVPSVNVNIEGEVSLRGATGVQILINGKPSILSDDAGNALGTITADMIEKVEVITNPSAKYEAEGTAGIINIVLKKNEKRGLNGSISVNTGIPQNHSIGVSLNRRTEKFNLFTQMGVGYRKLPTFKENTNRDKLNNTELNSDGTEYRNEQFYNFVLGSDYYINASNVLTLSGSFAYEVEDQPSATDFLYTVGNTLESDWTRTEDTEATNPKLQYELQYKRDFEDAKEHQLLFSAIGRFFGKEQSSKFTHTVNQGLLELNDQITETTFQEGKYTFNLDYTKPFNDHWSLEAGAQYLTNNVSNDFSVSNEMGDSFVIDPNLTNVFEYDQKVLGVYGTGAYEGEYWGVKIGMRVEHTDLETFLVNTSARNKNVFTNLFPSAHTSYKLSESVSFQAGYSRRIYRPRLWDLNPFFNVRDNFNIRAGNPNLLPEYTDSYEVGSIFIFEDISLNFIAYHRYTTDKIERVIIIEEETNVNTSRPENIGTNKATGLEANFKYNISKKLTLNGDANYNIFQRDGQFNEQVFDFTADKWTGKLMLKYKLKKGIDLELTGRHESREETVQGLRNANSQLDAGLRVKILKGKGVFNVSARDIFASRVRKLTIDNDTYFLERGGWRGRALTLGFSYGFGKGEAMHFSGRRR